MTIKQINKELSGSGYSIRVKGLGYQVMNEDGDDLFFAKHLTTALTQIGRNDALDGARFVEFEFLRGLLVRMGKRPAELAGGESYSEEAILAMRQEVAAGQDLKRVLMELGNSLVLEEGYDPAYAARHEGAADACNTDPIALFTAFLNKHEAAREYLQRLGYQWSMPEGKRVGSRQKR